MIRKAVKHFAINHGKLVNLYLKLCKPDGYEYSDFLKKWGGFQNIGINCFIMCEANVTDPYLTYIGNNVMLSACNIFCHDGSIAMLSRAYSKKLDRVAPVKILDNVFIGHGAIVLPNVTVGPNAIVAAGAVISKDVPANSIVAGNPAKVIGSVDNLVQKLEELNFEQPWFHLIQQRDGGFDPRIEPELKKLRKKYFFGEST